MKKLLSLLFIAFVGLSIESSTLNAQNSGQQSTTSMNINVSATVIGSIELTTIRNMRFGKVLPGQNTINISPIRDAEAGKMVASGIPNSRIRVRYVREWQLSSDRSDAPLTFYYNVAGSRVDDQETAELLETDNRDLHLNEEGNYYFWIGGRANIQNAQPGNYEGEFTIEIEYI